MSLFLKQSKFKSGKIYLSIVDGYWKDGKVKQKVYQKLGYLEDLKKLFDDPIVHYKNYVNELKKEFETKITTTFDLNKDNDFEDDTFNIGYAYLKKLFQDLDISSVLKNKQHSTHIEYSLSKACELLTYSRILDPGSIKYTYEHKNQFFEPFDLSLDDLYRSLTPLLDCKENIFKTIWENTKDKYNRDASTSYYDCTNYYFEIEYDDEDTKNENGEIIKKGIRKRGPEKNHRPDPIVEMGLLLDKQGFPISYNIFPGNTSEKETLIPEIHNIKRRHNIDKVIVVADRGLNCSENMYKLSGLDLDQKNRDGYVYGQSVRGADSEFKEWILKDDYKIDKIIDEDGNEIIFKHKSRIYPKKMYVIREDKGLTKSGNVKKQTITVDQKQMVYYSQKYADKQKRDRQMVIEKAKDLIKNPSAYTRATSYGAAGYINNIKFDKETGVVSNSSELSLNLEKIKEDEKFDGYYSIVTSEEHLSDLELRNIYKGLSKIEETFKITKSEFNARPINVRLEDHIDAHFLICFISLVIIRLLQYDINNKYTIKNILEKIKNFKCTHETGNIYKFIGYKPEIQYLNRKLQLKLDKKYDARENIKKILKY
ncbi:MAG: IS1634 family transposase [Clostridium sp.]|nr:IS1634 family transposase [Clostridium sp.]